MQAVTARDEAITYAQKFTLYAMLECLKLCPIMLLLSPYYAQLINKLKMRPQDAYTNKISVLIPWPPLECSAILIGVFMMIFVTTKEDSGKKHELKGTPLSMHAAEVPCALNVCLPIIPDYARSAELPIIPETMPTY